MDWGKLISAKRYGKTLPDNFPIDSFRSEFQRDYDRIIFSSPFRRLQNKTQVFPLPGSVFVHNRLTHSLEVASVGKSLGNRVSKFLIKKYKDVVALSEIDTITGTASLIHDLGNPPFGHSGEKAISNFFESGKGSIFKDMVTPAEWADLTNFEGNANALRLLTHTFNGRREGGYVLTYTTLAAMVKYPFDATRRTKKNKYGFFQSEKESFADIAHETGLLQSNEGKWCRHPLVYLVEAADDISYQIMDIEDAHKLNILSTDETIGLLTSFFDKKEDSKFFSKYGVVSKDVTDKNEQIAFLRASVISHLVNKVVDIFIENEESIMRGEFTGSLVDYLQGTAKEAMNICSGVAWERIYNHRSVVEIEITGYNVLSTLLENYAEAIVSPQTEYAEKLLALLPLQYKEKTDSTYSKLRSILDFISGMTDLYAMDLYKLIKGIGI